jgi:predicted ATPase/DNA-binding SARP family transcriptional activator
MAVRHAFRLLGPLEAFADGRPLDLGGPKQRAVLAFLLLRANEVVPRERLIDELWGERPPPAARETIKVYVGRLRKLFSATGSRPRLVTRGGGYVLEVDPEQLDLQRFLRLVDAASHAVAASDAARAAADLRAALALWRGSPFTELGDVPFARTERVRLQELRLAALEERLEADLALGHESELVGELERLVTEHPFRERLRSQLMLALYRCGRQVEALDHYRRAARLFADELGIEPGPELRKRERAILEHDPALRPIRLAPSNLPAPPNRLIGRERELGELIALLDEPGKRLVTVTGTGGAGKTRLALEAASRIATAAAVRAYFVDLAPLTNPGSVPTAIASVVGCDDAMGADAESLGRFVAGRSVLLLLDNFEHLIDAAPQVAALLSAAPCIRVLATSRRPLRIRAEARYELGALSEGDATALFIERARAIDRGFVLTPELGELCRRLDALPLPIELAAARADRMTLETILAGLDRRFELLAEGARDLPVRQRTLRATVEWSYALLEPPASDIFAPLAVFAGGCTVDAAVRVCNASPTALDALADGALIRLVGERIEMLESIREFAIDQLPPEREQIVRRLHAHYYAALIEAALPSIGRADVVAAVASEGENVRAALRWTLEARDLDLYLKIAVAAAPFWAVRGQLAEADAWLQPGVAMAEEAPPALRAAVISAASRIAGRRGDLTRAEGLAMKAWALCRACGDQRGATAALLSAMTAAARAGDSSRHDELLEQLDVATHELADPVLRAGTLRALGATASRAGDHDRGRALTEEALDIARAADLELDVGQALCHLGIIALQANRPNEAREPLEQSLAIAHKLTFREAAAYSLSGLAALSVAEDDLTQAARLLAAADTILDDIGTTRLPFISDVDATTRAAIDSSIGDEGYARVREEAQGSTFDELVLVA